MPRSVDNKIQNAIAIQIAGKKYRYHRIVEVLLRCQQASTGLPFQNSAYVQLVVGNGKLLLAMVRLPVFGGCKQFVILAAIMQLHRIAGKHVRFWQRCP